MKIILRTLFLKWINKLNFTFKLRGYPWLVSQQWQRNITMLSYHYVNRSQEILFREKMDSTEGVIVWIFISGHEKRVRPLSTRFVIYIFISLICKTLLPPFLWWVHAGDIMGPTMNNLDSLLKMPFGCGEQNMMNFAPDVFVYEYLTVTDQNSPEIKDKAYRFMLSGKYWGKTNVRQGDNILRIAFIHTSARISFGE